MMSAETLRWYLTRGLQSLYFTQQPCAQHGGEPPLKRSLLCIGAISNTVHH